PSASLIPSTSLAAQRLHPTRPHSSRGGASDGGPRSAPRRATVRRSAPATTREKSQRQAERGTGPPANRPAGPPRSPRSALGTREWRRARPNRHRSTRSRPRALHQRRSATTRRPSARDRRRGGRQGRRRGGTRARDSGPRPSVFSGISAPMISRSSYPGHITEIVTATAVPPSPRYRRPERCPSSLETYEQSRGDRLGRFARRRSYIFVDLCSIHIRIASRDIDELIDDLIEDGSQH